MDLIKQLSDPALLETMTIGDKINAGLMVTLIGMSITFIALLILWTAIVVMTKLLVKKPKPEVAVVAHQMPAVTETQVAPEVEDDEALIAVITAAIAASLKTSIHNIVVQNIVRVPDETPAWAKTGRVDQMNARF